MNHNIKLEVLPLVLEVMRGQTTLIKSRLKQGDCFCAEGCIAEAYLRAHPDEKRFGWHHDVLIDFEWQTKWVGTLPGKILDWALNDSTTRPMVILTSPKYQIFGWWEANDGLEITPAKLADILETK